MKDRFVFSQLNSPLQRQWKADRAIRQRIAFTRSWRGCMGLAMLLKDVEATRYHGDRALLANEHLSWLALRDLPPGHFPGHPLMNRRDVNYATLTGARLCHGMPMLDFGRSACRSWDFRCLPYREQIRCSGKSSWLLCPSADTLDPSTHRREFAMLNGLSQQMTRYADRAAKDKANVRHRSWLQRRDLHGPLASAIRSSHWMPRPYLAFNASQSQQLYWLATSRDQGCGRWRCAHCRNGLEFNQLRRGPHRIQVLEQGDIAADCCHCQRRGKWFLEDLAPAASRRHFNRAFRQGFCKAVAGGLVLGSIGSETYCGIDRSGSRDFQEDEGQGPTLLCHRLRNRMNGQQRRVYLPISAKILVHVAEDLEPSQPWARLLPAVPQEWTRQDLNWQWASVPDVCGGRAMRGILQQLWFTHQALSLDQADRHLLFPAELVAEAVRDLPPQGLWWDIAPAGPYLDGLLEAAVFPPLIQRHWTHLRFALAGDVNVDASIDDPRFCAKPLGQHSRTSTRAA